MPELVAIDLPGGPAFVEALQRAWDRGDAVLPLDQRIAAPAKAAIIKALRPTAIADEAGLRHLGAGRPTQPGDALVVATSGTTGRPKGVVLTHHAVEASARATTQRLNVSPANHRWLACLPLNHVGGLSVVTRSLITGTPLTVIPDPKSAEEHAGPEVFVSLVATLLQRIKPETFHTIVLGGGPKPDNTPANAVVTYGMTETGSGVVYDGRPLDGVEIRIDRTTQEIRIRAPMLLRAYRDGTVPKDAQGWYATGDAGHIDGDGRLDGDGLLHGDGRLHVDGRLSEVIISGGENIWPAPVEAILAKDPLVREVAIAGRPDPEWGQRTVAWVVPKDPNNPPSLDHLKALVSENLAPFAAPRELILLGELPKTPLGKVRRDQLPDP